MAQKPKTKLPKPVQPKETIASLKLEILRKDKVFNELCAHADGLKKSFDMVKANFEREKDRLDKTIQSLLNVTSK
jgi:hypothetical protein